MSFTAEPCAAYLAAFANKQSKRKEKNPHVRHVYEETIDGAAHSHKPLCVCVCVCVCVCAVSYTHLTLPTMYCV